MVDFNVWKAESRVAPAEVPQGQQQEPLSAACTQGDGVPGLNTITSGVNAPLNSAPGAQSCSWAAQGDTTVPTTVPG